MEQEQAGSTPQANSTPAPAGNPVESVEQLKARIEQVEREKQGIFNDLRSEREKRQALERAQTAPALPNSVPANEDTTPQDHGLTQVVRPLYEQVTHLQAQSEREKALLWFAKKEKIDVEDAADVINTPQFKEAQEVISKYKLHNMPMLEGIKAAHDLLSVTRERAKKSQESQEVQRNQQIASQSVPATGAPAEASKVIKVSKAEIAKMSLKEYSALKEKAAKSGETIHVE